MNIREAVAAYIAEGRNVLPIVKTSKVPDVMDWVTRTFTVEDFTESHNVAVRLDGGIVDVDLDCPEAALAAASLLPVTRRHGRKTNPGSHYWYTCDLKKPYTFKDLSGDMLMEMRSSANQYTIVPPSVHPSGEPIVWEHDRAPLAIDQKDLLNAARATAIATLFGRHWPSGSRHFGAAHLAGFLLRCGFDQIWTLQIVKLAATIAKDDEVDDRVRVARTTAEKLVKGGKVTGAPSLKDVFDRGDDLAARVYQWLEREGDDILDKINAQHFVSMYGSKAVVVKEREDGTITLHGFGDFRELHYNQKIGKQRLGEWWLSHPQQRRYDEIVFAPPPRKATESDYNAWKGFAVPVDEEPNPEKRCARFLDHLYQVICSSNELYFAYLLDWCGITVQRPGVPIGVAVVLRGESGAGKGTFVDSFGGLFGPHYAQVSSQQQITGRFNAVLARRIVIFADEAIWAGNKTDAGNLKRLITEKTLMVEPKFRDAVSEPNCVHLLMATNEDWVWPATFKERRGFILDVDKLDHCDKTYFKGVHDEWNNGGASAFLALMLQRQVPERMDSPPATDALQEQQELSMSPLQEWWYACLENGEIAVGQGWPEFVSNHTLFEVFVQAQDAVHNRIHRMTPISLGKKLKRMLPDTAVSERKLVEVNVSTYGQPTFQSHRLRGWTLPPLSACRHKFDQLTGLRRNWPDADASQPEMFNEL